MSGLQFDKRRSLSDSTTQPPSEGDEHDARAERDAPTPRFEGVPAERQGYGGDHPSSQYGPASRTHLGKRRIPASLVRGTMFERQEHRAGPFAADGSALGKSQGHE